MLCTVNRVDFDCRSNVESRLLETERQTACTGEEINSDWAIHTAPQFTPQLAPSDDSRTWLATVNNHSVYALKADA